ncbi:MAG: 2'-5' RNA ligase family protein [Armatimonas sp.]
MPYAIVLTLDARAEENIRRLWDGLADAKLAAALRDGGAIPHLTMAVFKELPDPVGLVDALDTIQATELNLTMGHIGVFPGEEGVVFAGVTLTNELQELHRTVHTLLEERVGERRAYYLPGRWVPHITLAIRLDGRERAAAVRWLLNPPVSYPDWPLKARAIAVTLLELPGDRRIARRLLAAPEKAV